MNIMDRIEKSMGWAIFLAVMVLAGLGLLTLILRIVGFRFVAP